MRRCRPGSATWAAKEQADADAHYKNSAPPQLQSRKAAWIANAQINVDRDLPVVPWNDPPPRRSVFLVDSSAPVIVQILAPADASLTAPVMPVKTPSLPSQFFVTGSPFAADGGIDAVLKEIARLRGGHGAAAVAVSKA